MQESDEETLPNDGFPTVSSPVKLERNLSRFSDDFPTFSDLIEKPVDSAKESQAPVIFQSPVRALSQTSINLVSPNKKSPSKAAEKLQKRDVVRDNGVGVKPKPVVAAKTYGNKDYPITQIQRKKRKKPEPPPNQMRLTQFFRKKEKVVDLTEGQDIEDGGGEPAPKKPKLMVTKPVMKGKETAWPDEEDGWTPRLQTRPPPPPLHVDAIKKSPKPKYKKALFDSDEEDGGPDPAVVMKEFTQNLDYRKLNPLNNPRSCRRLEAEILNLGRPENLTAEQLNYLLHKNRQFLMEIIQGRRPSKRHAIYHSGDKAAVGKLDSMVPVHFFTDQILSFVWNIFPTLIKGQKSSYVSKVLLPEFLLQAYGEVRGLNRQQTSLELKRLWDSVDFLKGHFV